jgi:ACDE family multidrug resistance protein
VQAVPSRSGKCGTGPRVPRARPRPEPRTPPPSGSGRPGSLVVYAIGVTGVLANAVVAPALPDIARALEVDEAGIGLVVAAASLPGVVVAPLIGVAADRFGRRTVVLPCLMVFGVGGMAAMLAPSFAVLLAARLLQGFGAAGLVNLSVVIIGDRHESPTARAAAIGRNGAVLTVGLAVLPALGGVLVSLWGWRAAFAPYAAAFVVALAAAAVLPPGPPPGARSLAEQVKGAGRYLLDRRVAAMTATGLCGFVLVFGVVLTVLPIDLDQRFGAGPALRGLVVGLPAAAAVGVSLAMGRLSGRWPTWDLVFAGFAIFAVTFLAVALAPTVVVVAMAVAAYGLGEALVIVTLQAYAAGLAPAAHRGVMVAVWVAAVRAGQALGPVLAGICLSTVGARGSFVVASAAATAVAGAVATFRRSLRLSPG